MSHTVTETCPRNTHDTGLRGFMNKGGFWRLFRFLVLYLAVYQLAGLLIRTVMPDAADADLLSSVGAIFEQVTFGPLVGGVVLFAAASHLGWTKSCSVASRSSWSWPPLPVSRSREAGPRWPPAGRR